MTTTVSAPELTTSQVLSPSVAQLIDAGFSGIILKDPLTGAVINAVAIERFGSLFVKLYSVELSLLMRSYYASHEEFSAWLARFERL